MQIALTFVSVVEITDWSGKDPSKELNSVRLITVLIMKLFIFVDFNAAKISRENKWWKTTDVKSTFSC